MKYDTQKQDALIYKTEYYKAKRRNPMRTSPFYFIKYNIY